MKRFAWPLQRLLDVTMRREEALRGELAALAAQIAALGRTIARRRGLLRGVLARLGLKGFQQRLAQQQTVMTLAAMEEGDIRKLQQQAAELERKRSDTMRRFMAVRSSRKTLDSLRATARARYLREQDRLEQKHLDETAQIAHVRNRRARAEWASGGARGA